MTGICRNFKQTIIQSEPSMKQLLWKWEIKNDWILKLEKLKLSFQILEFIQARFLISQSFIRVPIGYWLLRSDWLLKTYLRRFISLGFVLTGVTILIFSAIGVIIYRNEIILWASASAGLSYSDNGCVSLGPLNSGFRSRDPSRVWTVRIYWFIGPDKNDFF